MKHVPIIFTALLTQFAFLSVSQADVGTRGGGDATEIRALLSLKEAWNETQSGKSIARLKIDPTQLGTSIPQAVFTDLSDLGCKEWVRKGDDPIAVGIRGSSGKPTVRVHKKRFAALKTADERRAVLALALLDIQEGMCWMGSVQVLNRDLRQTFVEINQWILKQDKDWIMELARLQKEREQLKDRSPKAPGAPRPKEDYTYILPMDQTMLEVAVGMTRMDWTDLPIQLPQGTETITKTFAQVHSIGLKQYIWPIGNLEGNRLGWILESERDMRWALAFHEMMRILSISDDDYAVTLVFAERLQSAH